MPNIIEFPKMPPEAPISVTLTSEEWFAVAMELAGRFADPATLARANEKIFAQLKNAGGK